MGEGANGEARGGPLDRLLEQTQRPPGNRGGRRGSTAARAVVVAGVIGLLVATLLASPGVAPASAAQTGAGFEDITPFGGYLGNYVMPDGTRAYCIDSAADWPSGTTDGGSLVQGLTTSWGDSLPAETVARLNYALTKWGQTDDPVQAAAVNAYMYAFTSGYARSVGQGFDAGAYFINGDAAVLAAYTTIFTESQSYSGVTAGGSAQINIVMSSAYAGVVTVTANPTNAIGTLTLTGAVFADTGASTATVQNGSQLAIRGIPDDATVKYNVRATATFSAPGGPGPTVTLYTTGDQQRTIRGGTVTSLNFSAAEAVTDPLSTEFSPVLSSQVVSRAVKPGDAFNDTVTATVADGSEPWRQNSGVYVPISATGTLYGPFAAAPIPGPVPAGAPIVGTEQLTMTGPGTYTTSGTLTATAGGFYTWVWTIEEADQGAAGRFFLLDGYRFEDQFGQQAETHLVPVTFEASSKVTVATVTHGGQVCDTLTVAIGASEWPLVGGEPVEAVFDGTAYFVTGQTAPAKTATVPASARQLGSATITADKPGTYRTTDCVTAPSEDGFIVWRWELRDNPDYFTAWADDFGVPAEMTQVRPALALTGQEVNVLPLVSAGAVLLLGGAGALILARRQRRRIQKDATKRRDSRTGRRRA